MRFQRPPSTNHSHQRQHPGCSCWDVLTDWLCLQLKLVSNETSFSHEPIGLILEPLELDLTTPQVPDRWVAAHRRPLQETFLGAPVFLSVTSESGNRSTSRSRRRSRILYQDMNCFYMKKDATPRPSPMNVFSLFRHHVCASVGHCPTCCQSFEDTSAHEQFVILGLLLVLTLLPSSPAKSSIGFLFFLCICHLVQRSMSQQKCKWADTIFVVSWGRCQNFAVWLQPGDVKRNGWPHHW